MKVLVVEDEEMLREHMAYSLEELGLSVTEADCPSSAYPILGKVKFDLVISDYRMPGANGKDLLIFMSKNGIDTPTIIFSGGGYDASICEFQNCLGVIDKPNWDKLAELVSSIREINQAA